METTETAVYTVAEVARLLGLSRSNTYARTRDGSIPSVRIGSRILVPKKALERLLEGATTRSETVLPE